MNGRHFTGEPIEIRLDRLIDALNSGNVPDRLDRDPELNDLAQALRATESVKEIQWPDTSFGRRLAARLSTELSHPDRTNPQAADNRPLDPQTTPATLNGRIDNTTGDERTFDLTNPARQSRVRTLAQIAAAVAGFAILTYVLVTVFRGASDNPSLGVVIDGQTNQIAFVKNVDGNAEIFLANADGFNQINLTDNPARDTTPSWSPDGEQLAFVSDREGSDALYVMNANGSDVREVFSPSLTGGGELRNVAWSPDGSSVAVMRIENSGGGENGQRDSRAVIVVPLEGGSHSVLTSGNATFDQSLTWSPDGTWIAYAGGWDARTGGYVYFADTTSQDGSRIQPVDASDGSWPTGGDVSWSSSGELAIAREGGIAIAQASTDTEEIDVIDQLSITDKAIARRVRWSPDGERLAVSLSTQTVWLINRDGSGLMEIPDTVRGTYPDWPDRPDWAPDPSWSPDGMHLAYMRAPETGTEGSAFDLIVVDTHDVRTVATIETGLAGPFLSPPAWRPSGAEPEQNRDAQASPTPTPENNSAEVVPTPPSTPDATMAIVPYELSCGGSAAVTGSGFVPGSTVDIFLGEQTPGKPDDSAILSTTADDDGAFQFEDLVPISTLIPNCEERTAEGGGELSFSAASVVEFDGEQRYAEPAATTTTLLLPTSSGSSGATLALDPAIGTCDTTVVASVTGFEPGTQVTFGAVLGLSDNPAILDQHPTVLEDGTFSVELTNFGRFIGCGLERTTPESGLQYGIHVQTGVGSKPDGDDWRDPSASTTFTLVSDPELAAPEALEGQLVDEASAAVREFLSEPEAEFEVIEINHEDRYVRLSRQIDDAYDEFTYDVDLWGGIVVSATVQSHASGYSPSALIDTDRALEIATEIARRSYSGFDQLTLHETSDQATVFGADGQDQVFSATWQRQADSGAWLPTVLKVSVDMETGLVTGYSYSFESYRGIEHAQVPQEDAVATVEQAIATEPTLTGATVGRVELTTSYKVLELDENGNVTAGEWILVWHIYLDNAPDTAPGPYIEVDAQSGDLLTEFGEPGGQG